jgi:AraC-like DNA-binding protein
MHDLKLYERAYTGEKAFPLQVLRYRIESDAIAFYSHWHEQIELLYITKGKAVVECNAKPVAVSAGDLVVININELHSGHCVEGPLEYYCIMFDMSLLIGGMQGSCEQKYLVPLQANKISFENLVSESAARGCVEKLIEEFNRRSPCYELLVKSELFMLLGILMSRYVRTVLSDREHRAYVQNLKLMNMLLEYIERHYADDITVDQLADMCCLSKYYFCRLFKKLTGKSVNKYINLLRIDKAELLLRNTGANVTEVAMATGFNDANYFSRLYKKVRAASPSAMRKT